jgi:hypothetical protein
MSSEPTLAICVRMPDRLAGLVNDHLDVAGDNLVIGLRGERPRQPERPRGPVR